MTFSTRLPVLLRAGQASRLISSSPRSVKVTKEVTGHLHVADSTFKHVAANKLVTGNKQGREKSVIPARSPKLPPTHSIWTAEQLDEVRHILRAILRECTYLPDPHARTYLRSHALSRFRDYTLQSKPAPLLLERRHAQVKLARKSLSELRRGNAGELKVVIKILHLTYGRTGKRRHDLLKPLLESDHGVTSADTSSVEQQARDDAAASWPSRTRETNLEEHKRNLPKLTGKLEAVLASQMRFQPPNETRPHPRSLNPKIPEKNTWERPMPWKRVKNATKKWYAKLLERTMAPLDNAAWEELRRRAMGLVPFEPVPKRARGTSATQELPRESLLEKDLGLAPIRTPQNVFDNVDGRVRSHSITKRFMQRRWAAVFAQCAKMDWDSDKQKWIVTWGSDVMNQEHKRKGCA